LTPEEDGTRMRLCIVEALENLECSINQDNNVISSVLKMMMGPMNK